MIRSGGFLHGLKNRCSIARSALIVMFIRETCPCIINLWWSIHQSVRSLLLVVWIYRYVLFMLIMNCWLFQRILSSTRRWNSVGRQCCKSWPHGVDNACFEKFWTRSITTQWRKYFLLPHILWCSSQHESPSSQPRPGTLKLRFYNKNSPLFDDFTPFILRNWLREEARSVKWAKSLKPALKNHP